VRAHASSRAETAALAALAEVVVAVDLDQQFVLSQLARRGPWNDCANLRPSSKRPSQQTRIGLVLPTEFDSERNHTYIANGSEHRA